MIHIHTQSEEMMLLTLAHRCLKTPTLATLHLLLIFSSGLIIFSSGLIIFSSGLIDFLFRFNRFLLSLLKLVCAAMVMAVNQSFSG